MLKLMSIGQEAFLLTGGRYHGALPRQEVRGWFMRVVSAEHVEFYSAFAGKSCGVRENAAPVLAEAAEMWPFGVDVEVPKAQKAGIWKPPCAPRFFRGEVVGWHCGFRPKDEFQGVKYERQLVPHVAVRCAEKVTIPYEVNGRTIHKTELETRTLHMRVGFPDALGYPDREGWHEMSVVQRMREMHLAIQDAFELGTEVVFHYDGQRCWWNKEIEEEGARQLNAEASTAEILDAFHGNRVTDTYDPTPDPR